MTDTEEHQELLEETESYDIPEYVLIVEAVERENVEANLCRKCGHMTHRNTQGMCSVGMCNVPNCYCSYTGY